MDRRKLIVAVGALAVAIVALRRRARRDGVEIEIESPARRDERDPDEGDGADVESLEGIGPAYAARLREAGVADLGELVAADPADLAAASGIAEGRIRNWIDRARERPDV